MWTGLTSRIYFHIASMNTFLYCIVSIYKTTTRKCFYSDYFNGSVYGTWHFLRFKIQSFEWHWAPSGRALNDDIICYSSSFILSNKFRFVIFWYGETILIFCFVCLCGNWRAGIKLHNCKTETCAVFMVFVQRRWWLVDKIQHNEQQQWKRNDLQFSNSAFFEQPWGRGVHEQRDVDHSII